MSNQSWTELSERLSALAEDGGRSVVRVEARRAPASGIVWSPDGVVVTAHHNVEWDEDIEVGLADGRTPKAELVGRDPSTDLAVLRIEARGLPAPAWAEPDSLKAGHLLLSLSRPGRALRVGLGPLARAAGDWRAPAGGKLDRYLEADLGLHPGFSGALVLDLAGRAVGMATAGLSRGAALVVPPPTLRRVVGQLLAHGRVRRGFLGVATVPVRLPPPLEKAAGQAAALLVTAVEEGTPAQRGGLLLGDALLAFGGTALSHPGDLLPLLEEERIGQAVALRLVRAGEVREVAVTVGTRERGKEARG
ncbi:MAG TPA: trypsin-like peptidase domain-containing protein [Anaeromyxobacteraceae bacterium]|nr:trypsin-like peptidase domain-containing protein [Anaeromyxobacteraceae bacterium]